MMLRNDALLRMVGYDPEDLVSGHIRWREVMPPEWRDRDAQLVQELKMFGSLQPFDKEYLRNDGSRVPCSSEWRASKKAETKASLSCSI